MFALRPAAERGRFDHGWLDTRHTFSFADYHDPRFMGFRVLRVINDDRVQAGKGFGKHGHRDMEIISYVLEGSLAHKDTMGTASTIWPGDVQAMSAGTGVQHSEFNASSADAVHFLQIWILPERSGLQPSYEQRTFTAEDKRGKLCLVASRDGRNSSVVIHQDVDLYATIIEDGHVLEHALRPGRHAWLQVASGTVQFAGVELKEGDGVAISDEPVVRLTGAGAAEVLLFDLP